MYSKIDLRVSLGSLARLLLRSARLTNRANAFTSSHPNKCKTMVKSGRGRYNTGHWTDDESRLLHLGLERHGRDWIAISRLVGTRCVLSHSIPVATVENF